MILFDKRSALVNGDLSDLISKSNSVSYPIFYPPLSSTVYCRVANKALVAEDSIHLSVDYRRSVNRTSRGSELPQLRFLFLSKIKINNDSVPFGKQVSQFCCALPLQTNQQKGGTRDLLWDVCLVMGCRS